MLFLKIFKANQQQLQQTINGRIQIIGIIRKYLKTKEKGDLKEFDNKLKINYHKKLAVLQKAIKGRNNN